MTFRISKLLWLVTFAALSVYLIVLYFQLPDQNIAVHFDFNGKPNGWMSKATLLFFNVSILLFTNGICLVLYLIITRIPLSKINWPHKEYWLNSPERIKILYNRIRSVLCITSGFSNSILFSVLVIIKRQLGPNGSSSPSVGVAALLLSTVIFMVMIFRIVQSKDETRS